MPSRRMLAVRMGVNPMTVQKAYEMLEEMGLLHTPSGKNSVIRVDAARINAIRAEIFERELTNLVTTAMTMGITGDELAQTIKETYGRFQL